VYPVFPTQQVYAYDQRFHGDSDSPNHGFHVARLAVDLRDFLQALDLTEVTVVGSSMGCAVIWSYVELFGLQRLRQAVFVVSCHVRCLTNTMCSCRDACAREDSYQGIGCEG
jgi:pimeloyl-ACP methyl ester carboxylesterase